MVGNNNSLRRSLVYRLLKYIIAIIWFINGFFCKLLNLVPRHQQIVSRILGDDHTLLLTRIIGVLETIMAVWIISGYRSRLNAITQMLIIATMNILEFILVPDLLLWGRYNALFAFVFIFIIAYNEYYLKNKSTRKV